MEGVEGKDEEKVKSVGSRRFASLSRNAKNGWFYSAGADAHVPVPVDAMITDVEERFCSDLVGQSFGFRILSILSWLQRSLSFLPPAGNSLGILVGNATPNHANNANTPTHRTPKGAIGHILVELDL